MPQFTVPLIELSDHAGNQLNQSIQENELLRSTNPVEAQHSRLKRTRELAKQDEQHFAKKLKPDNSVAGNNSSPVTIEIPVADVIDTPPNHAVQKPRLFNDTKNRREIETNVGEEITFEAPYSLCVPTHDGDLALAQYYNQKRFQNDALGRQIFVVTGDEECRNKSNALIVNPSCQMAGLFFKPLATDNHPTPIVLEKRNNEIHLFVSDSLGVMGGFVAKKLKEMLTIPSDMILKIHLCHSNRTSNQRQKDEGSCHSDGFYYLQRALRLGSLCDKVKFTPSGNADAIYDIFYELPDLLLTAQNSKVLQQNPEDAIVNVDATSRLILGKVPNSKTFGDKTSPYKREVEYSAENSQKRKFNEKGFLTYVNQKHRKILEKL